MVPNLLCLKKLSLAVQKHVRSNKIAILEFPKAEGVAHLSGDYHIINRQVLAEKSLSIEEHCIVKEHSNGGNKGTLACQQKEISSNSGKTGLTGSINWSDRSMKNVIVGFHQEEKARYHPHQSSTPLQYIRQGTLCK